MPIPGTTLQGPVPIPGPTLEGPVPTPGPTLEGLVPMLGPNANYCYLPHATADEPALIIAQQMNLIIAHHESPQSLCVHGDMFH